MVVCLFSIQLFLCLGILRREVVRLRCRHFASSLFFVVYTIVYVVEPLVLHLVFGGAKTIVAGSSAKFDDPYVYYLFNAFGLTLLTTYLLFGRARPDGAANSGVEVIGPSDEADHRRQAGIAAGIVIAGALLFVHSTRMGVVDLLVATRFAWIAEGTFSVFWLTVSSYLLALAGAFSYHVRVGKSKTHLLNVAGFAAIVLVGMMTKDRKWVIYLLSGWLAGSYERSGRRLFISRRSASMLATLFCVLVVSQFIRDVLVRAVFGETIVLADELARWGTSLIETGDISYFYRASLEAIHQNLNRDFVVWFALPRRLVFFFLPTNLSGGLKVEDIAAIFSDVVDGGDSLRRGNMPPGLFGLFVISFGWFPSLFVIPLLAFLIKRLDRIFASGSGAVRQAILALYAFAVVLAFRGDESSAVYFIISSLLLMGIFDRLNPAGRRSTSS